MNDKSPEELNENYFKSLISTRASIGALYLGLAGAIISGLLIFCTWNIASYNYEMNPLKSSINDFMIFNIVFMSVTFLLIRIRFLRQIIYKHQGFASIWLAIFSIFLTFEIGELFYLVSIISIKNFRYGSLSSLFVIGCFVISYIGSLIYNIFWLKKMLNQGYPEELALLNYFSNSSVTSYGSLALISGVTILGRILNWTLTTGIGFSIGILLTTFFSRLTVEYSYAAYLLNTNRSYWVVYKDDEPPFKERLKIRLKKLSTYVVLGIGIFFFNTGFLMQKITTEPLYSIVGSIALIIVIFEAVVFVVWVFRKINKALKTKKLKKERDGKRNEF